MKLLSSAFLTFLYALLLAGIHSGAAHSEESTIRQTPRFLSDGKPEQIPSGGVVQKYQYQTALSESQSALDRRLGNYPFTDDSGQLVSLGTFWGKPLVISLIYTSCFHTCPITTRHLATVVEKAREVLGRESFNIALIGFDAQNDTPLAMRHFGEQQGVDVDGWSLLSGSPKTINKLTQELGFQFYPSPNGFDHLVQATVVDTEGVIYRQVYGEFFETPLLIEPLKDLVLNRPRRDQDFVSELVDKIKFFCTSYDPATDSYFFDYSLFIGMVIGGTVDEMTGLVSEVD